MPIEPSGPGILPFVPGNLNGFRPIPGPLVIDFRRFFLSNADLAPGVAMPATGPTSIDVLADPGFNGECPLWFYLLAESAVTNSRQTLGPVGGTIIAETLAGIMNADKASFFQADAWKPMSSPFGMQEFLKFAGVV